MSIGGDIKVVGGEIGYTLFGDLKAEYNAAIQLTIMQGNLQPLIAFYNANEGELNAKYGISLNQLIGMSPTQIATLDAYGRPPEEEKKSQGLNLGIGQDVLYGISAILLLGAGIILMIKSIRK